MSQWLPAVAAAAARGEGGGCSPRGIETQGCFSGVWKLEPVLSTRWKWDLEV